MFVKLIEVEYADIRQSEVESKLIIFQRLILKKTLHKLCRLSASVYAML